MKKFAIFAVLVAFICGCDKKIIPDNSVFKASLPCADCERIDQTLMLRKDGTFELNSTYVSQNPDKFSENGTYMINGDIITTTNSQKEQNFYKISGESLYILTDQKELPSGELKDKYILKLVK